ncbi:hypothetical protein SAMN04488009_2749 [Maribacter sedimenticola]|uniref:Uncharacterized protein n=2 Tax=Maribacter sedimenticola TaxID=228956 RepID=A0ABY1SIY1_9FLAO|nr:hypothetical protein SAMN04488009_2749 [Maribacter sedimenticola]
MLIDYFSVSQPNTTHMTLYRKNPGTVKLVLLLSLSLMFFTTSFLCAQSNMPDDSYTIITESSKVGPENPRRGLSLLRGLKKHFYDKGSYENIDDFSVYYSVVAAEAGIHANEKKFSTIYRLFGEIGEHIKPLMSMDDQYAAYYYFSKVMILIYKAQENNTVIVGNAKYRGEIKALIEEVKRFNFKEKITQNLVTSHLEQYL